MYCYKLNNSYTVYVNYHYLNQHKNSKKKTASNGPVKTIKPAQQTATVATQTIDNTAHVNTQKAVKFGSIVHLINVDTQQTCTWTLVHPDDIDLANQKFSVSSPIGKALIGRYVGECVSVKIPTGIAQYQILDLQN